MSGFIKTKKIDINVIFCTIILAAEKIENQRKYKNLFNLVQVNLVGPSLPQLLGGGVPSYPLYQLHQLHFHWGSSSSPGSEHTVDGTRYDMEVWVCLFIYMHEWSYK